MTAGQQGSDGTSALSGNAYRVTVADSGGAFAYLRGSLGALVPDVPFRTRNINRIQSTAAVRDLRLEIAPAGLAQSLFTRVIIQKTSGVWVVYTSASAAFTADSGLGTTLWQWGAGADVVYSAAGSGGFQIIL
jgi:hypothetical protein